MKRFAPAAALALAGLAQAQTEDKIEVARPSFSMFHEFGSIVSGTDRDAIDVENNFLQRTGLFVALKATRNDRLILEGVLGGIYWNPTYNENTNAESDLRYFAAVAPRASVTYLFGDLAKPSFLVEAGAFSYKYNDNARNLGEYMFRSISYPAQVFTGGLNWVGVDRASVLGLRLTQPLGQVFSHDLIVSLETTQLPYNDMNLTYMAKAKAGRVLKVGAGIQFSRILPIRPSHTNPDILLNRYFTFNDTTYIANPAYYTQRKNKSTGADSARFARGEALVTQLKGLVDNGDQSLSMDAALDSLESLYSAGTGSSYGHYDASAIKTVATFSFDPKPLLGDLPMFGSNDLILYGEASILGWKNYPILYENRMERTVAMIGFNVPTFRLLDVLAVEAEWFGSKQPNSNEYSQKQADKMPSTGVVAPFPQPSIYFDNMQGYDPKEWEEDDIKWSVFARRQLVKGLSLDLQAASDNGRGWVFPSGRRYWSFFRSPSDWYWMFKLTASI